MALFTTSLKVTPRRRTAALTVRRLQFTDEAWFGKHMR